MGFWCNRYESGDRLSPEHEETIIERLLAYHPECEKKIGSGVDYITVSLSFSHKRKHTHINMLKLKLKDIDKISAFEQVKTIAIYWDVVILSLFYSFILSFNQVTTCKYVTQFRYVKFLELYNGQELSRIR